ncbi:hypothetical protein SAMN05216490_3219 [Mucilaginibacter mallensis]|uniref:Uncharacterized protein n=1 Tax=Mucilaginibacter mallensis TaxID=652787 RepID=A0A1H1ZRM6_MUCMA|nr:hypothetical protein [Mucilaginibacter mallensis]SDT36269.1 hypothetical protein SAMN05216490_3219 [Mucilaginibacter mallensis]
MKYLVFSFLLILILLSYDNSFAWAGKDYQVVSPDRSTVLHIGLDTQGKLVYRIDYDHQANGLNRKITRIL